MISTLNTSNDTVLYIRIYDSIYIHVCTRRVIVVFTYLNTRWMYLRSTEMPHMLILEPLQEHIFLGPITALAVHYLFAVAVYVTLPLYFLFWLIADYLLFIVIQVCRIGYTICIYESQWFSYVSDLLTTLQAEIKHWRNFCKLFSPALFELKYMHRDL